MSYTDEAMQIPKRKPGKYLGEEDHHLTFEAIERLRRDLRDLEERQRPKAVEDLHRAAEMGDRSENAAYSEARGRLTGIDGRIFALKERIKHAVLIERGADAAGHVRIGSTVVVSVDGREKTYEILGSQETNPSKGRISHLSPLGSLLMNRCAGEEVVLETGGRRVAYRLLEVR